MRKKISLIFGIIILTMSFVLTGCSSAVDEVDVNNTENITENKTTNTTSATDSDTLEIKEIYIDIDTESWEAILAAPMEEEYYSASVTIDDETVTNIGFRTKGNSSLQQVADSDSERYGFRVNIDKYEDDQTICGTNEFVLNASFSDPSYMREYITYMAMEEIGGITPDVSYANLYINEEYYGLYLYIEAYDDTFVEGITDDDEACLYKADGENCTLDSATGTKGFESQYGDDEEMKNIDRLISAIEKADDGSYTELEEILDVDSVLQAMAINYLCGNYDSYSGDKAHNYFLLFADGEFSYIGWDYNMAFGGYSSDGGASVNIDVEEPIYNTTIEDRPLYKVLLENDEYVEQYNQYLDQVAEYLSDWEEIVATIEVQIESYVEVDPTAFYTYEEFQENLVVSGDDLTQIQASAKSEMGRGQREIAVDEEISEDGIMLPAEGEMAEGGRMLPPDGEMPEDGMMMPADREMPEDGRMLPMDGEMPEDGRMMPMDGEMPEGGEMPEDGEILEGIGDTRMNGNGGIQGGEMNKEVISIADYIVTILEKYASSK